MEHQIMSNEHDNRGAFFIERDGKSVARMTYSRTNPSLVIVDHTEVDDSLKGQGVGRKLLDAVVSWARETNTRIAATCPFVTAQFAKDPSIRDVLA